MENSPLICVPIAEKTTTKAISSAKSYQKMGADLLEFRIDALENPTHQMVEEVLEEIKIPVIATNRIESEGGFFKGSERERIDLLLVAAPHADYVDIELNSNQNLQAKVIKAASQTIISYHNFTKTPSLIFLRKIIEDAHKLGDIAKLAVLPHNMEDTLKILKLILEYPHTIGIAMGEYGKYTRIMGPLFGAPFTYAMGDKSTAPGQMDIKTTRWIMEKLQPRL